MTVPGAFVAGDQMTAANMNLLPGGASARAITATTQQTGITTAYTDVTTLTLTFTALASRRYKISYQVYARQLTAGGNIVIGVDKGGTIIQNTLMTAVTSEEMTLSGFIYNVPGAGSVTYKLRAKTSAGTLSINSGSATEPGVLLVEDIGT